MLSNVNDVTLTITTYYDENKNVFEFNKITNDPTTLRENRLSKYIIINYYYRKNLALLIIIKAIRHHHM